MLWIIFKFWFGFFAQKKGKSNVTKKFLNSQWNSATLLNLFTSVLFIDHFLGDEPPIYHASFTNLIMPGPIKVNSVKT